MSINRKHVITLLFLYPYKQCIFQKKKNSFNIVRRQRLTKETILEMLPGFLLQGALPKDIRRGQQISPTQENNLVLKVSTETAFRKPSPRLFLPLYLDQRAQQVHSTEQRLCKGFWEKVQRCRKETGAAWTRSRRETLTTNQVREKPRSVHSISQQGSDDLGKMI